MVTSDKMREQIKQWEGLRLKAYRCPAGVWTIGYGHTVSVLPDMTITAAQANQLFCEDIAAVEAQVNATLASASVVLSQNRFDAVVSFVYNLGLTKFCASTLWRKIRADVADPTIADEFRRWVYAGGSKLPGLVARREVEARTWSL